MLTTSPNVSPIPNHFRDPVPADPDLPRHRWFKSEEVDDKEAEYDIEIKRLRRDWQGKVTWHAPQHLSAPALRWWKFTTHDPETGAVIPLKAFEKLDREEGHEVLDYYNIQFDPPSFRDEFLDKIIQKKNCYLVTNTLYNRGVGKSRLVDRAGEANRDGPPQESIIYWEVPSKIADKVETNRKHPFKCFSGRVTDDCPEGERNRTREHDKEFRRLQLKHPNLTISEIQTSMANYEEYEDDL